ASVFGALALPLTVAPPAHAADGPSACRTSPSVPLDAEQARLADPRTTALVERAGFADFVRRFPAALCATRGRAEADRLVDDWGEALWQASVRRAQDRRRGGAPPPRAAPHGRAGPGLLLRDRPRNLDRRRVLARAALLSTFLTFRTRKRRAREAARPIRIGAGPSSTGSD
ncbi:hypothetical protein ACFVZQ_14060, partial [Streptomyces sp. NPDC059538]